MLSSLSQYGITWTFDKAYPVGQFVNGDYWVVGPVTITAISPAPSGGRNGSMVNPMPGQYQAYDDRQTYYSAALLRVPPYALAAGESLVSSQSLTSGDLTNGTYIDMQGYDVVRNNATWWATYTKSAAILTCVAEVPPVKAFRPPYVGPSKPYYLADNLQWGILPHLSIPTSTPSLMNYTRYFQRPWIDHQDIGYSRSMHPADNMPNYGQSLCGMVGDAALLLCLDYTDTQKQNLLAGLVQIGIDNYHTILLNPHLWYAAGGHGIGRKFPVLFAGLMLNQPEMLAARGYSSSEDMSTYYGSDRNPAQTLWTGWQDSGHPYAQNVLYVFQNPDNPNYCHENYTPAQWNLPPFPTDGMWPNKHEGYKRICALAFPGQTIAARILGLKSAWAHEAYFSFVDRWMYENETEPGGVIEQIAAAGWGSTGPTAGNAYSQFARDMYITHRPSY